MNIVDTDVDAITTAWIRNPSDVAAVRNGCRFDVVRGAYAVWWIENVLKLYEGEQAGEPVYMRGCAECSYCNPREPRDGEEDDRIPRLFDWDEDGQAYCVERARLHSECVAAGHAIDWQYDCTMRVFGWVRWSDHWDDEIRRFRKASIWVSKKNKKTPTMSAWGLYLMAGDGEGGQHVYFASKDGSQVKDGAIKHVFSMLDQSEELSDECTPNKTLWQITHEPTRSTILPMSSSNERTQKSKEGKNGCVMVDETHIVDRAFIQRIDRAGISRKQPLHAEFSTAGDDPDGYGMEQFQKATKVLSGETEEQSLFAAIYAAPQDLTDADLDADPLKYGRMANPAFGHTVDPEEFLADYAGSKQAPGTLAKFKMYRLNIWQNAASPWLPMSGWDKGRCDFKADDLKGRKCWAGLDLSTVSDFTALALAFPEADERFKVLWWFWLPEETATKNQHRIDIQKWKEDPRCNLILTPGARIDYGYITGMVRSLHEQYDIQELAYDRYNAESTTQEITEGSRDHEGNMIRMGTGIPRVEFGQGMLSMNEPSKHFEALVIDGKVEHNGDPLMRWMIQNATIKPDANMNYKPLKSRDLTKKIDGVVAAIMAIARAAMNDTDTWTFKPGSLAL